MELGDNVGEGPGGGKQILFNVFTLITLLWMRQ